MEHHDPSQRQYAPNPYAAQQQQQSSAAAQYSTQPTGERFRQTSFLQQSPTGATTSARAGSDAQQVYAFQQGGQYGVAPSVPSTALSYAPNTPAQPSQRQPQPTTYQSYGGNLMYGVAQGQVPQQQAQPSVSVYDQIPQYRPSQQQQRQSGASETLATQFGVPPGAQYYLAGQAAPHSTTTPDLAVPQLTSQQQHQQSGPGYDQAFNDYQTRVRTIFTWVHDGTLRDVGQQLLQISQYLLGNAEALGMCEARDNLWSSMLI
jgi:hypothetical protein